MAIVLKNEYTSELINLLQRTDEKQRLVVYYGVAHVLGEVIAEYVNKNEARKANYQIVATALVDMINEMAILDRTKLEAVIISVYRYYITGKSILNNASRIYQIGTLDDALGVSDTYSLETKHLINTNIGLYKAAIIATMNNYAKGTFNSILGMENDKS